MSLENLLNYKEFGLVGFLVYIVLKLGKPVLDWVLDWAGVKVKRTYSREDELSKNLKAESARLDNCESRLNKIEAVFRINHGLTFSVAEGMEHECEEAEKHPCSACGASVSVDKIRFFSSQLRQSRTVEQIWQSDVSPSEG